MHIVEGNVVVLLWLPPPPNPHPQGAGELFRTLKMSKHQFLASPEAGNMASKYKTDSHLWQRNCLADNCPPSYRKYGHLLIFPSDTACYDTSGEPLPGSFYLTDRRGEFI